MWKIIVPIILELLLLVALLLSGMFDPAVISGIGVIFILVSGWVLWMLYLDKKSGDGVESLRDSMGREYLRYPDGQMIRVTSDQGGKVYAGKDCKAVDRGWEKAIKKARRKK